MADRLTHQKAMTLLLRSTPSYAERHQHLNVLDVLRACDPYSLREAIRMNLFEGSRNLRQHLSDYEARAAISDPGRKRV